MDAELLEDFLGGESVSPEEFLTALELEDGASETTLDEIQRIRGRLPDMSRDQIVGRLVYMGALPELNGKPRQVALSPTFPLAIFPERLCDYVRAVATSIEMQPGAVGFSVFGVLSACYGTHVRVHVNDGYTTWCNEYCMLVGASSFGKTPIFKHVLKPLRAIEIELQEDMAEAVVDARVKLTRLKADRDLLVKKYKGEHSAGLEAQLKAIDEEIAEQQAIRKPQVIVSDVTPEVLVKVMSENGEASSMASGDTPLWDKLLGQSTGRPPDLAAFLSAYDAEFYRCDRIIRECNELDAPRLAIMGGTQDAMVRKLHLRPELMDRGLIPRFLFCVVDGDPVYNDKNMGVSPELTNFYVATLKNLGLLFRRNFFEPFTLNEEAEKLYVAWRNLFKRRHREKTGDLHDIAPFARKLENKVLRWAGLLHPLWTKPLPRPAVNPLGTLTEDDIDRALLLVDFAIANYRAVDALVYEGPVATLTTALRLWFKSGQQFTTRQLARSQGDCRRADKATREAALQELEEEGVVQVQTQETGGRPSRVVV